MEKNDWFKYIVTFILTAGIFATVFYISNMLDAKRLDEVRSIQDKITTDLLSSETQFALLNNSSCSTTTDPTSILTSEISRLSERLGYMEDQFGSNNPEVISLKKNYSLLLIKDYLLLSEISQKCHTKAVYVFYFYSSDNCEDCRREWYVISALRDKYPTLRVYAFDTNLDLSAINTLREMYRVTDVFPTFAFEGKTLVGYKTVEELEAFIPGIQEIIKQQKADKEAAEKANAPKPKPTPPVKTGDTANGTQGSTGTATTGQEPVIPPVEQAPQTTTGN